MSKGEEIAPGSVPSPIKPRSKAEILADMKKNQTFQRKIKFVKEKFWPALLSSSQNIKDATILLEGFNTQVMQSFLSRMKEVKVKDLELEDKLDKTSPKYQENLDLLHLFDDMSVFDAKDHIEGMKNEIEIFITDELKERPLSSLKPRWLGDE